MGFLVAVFAFGCSLAANVITNSVMGEGYWEENQWTFGLSLLVAACLSWFVGQSLASKGAKTFIDKETGEEVVIAPNHSLFFIKMHWWGPILLVFGIFMILKGLLS